MARIRPTNVSPDTELSRPPNRKIRMMIGRFVPTTKNGVASVFKTIAQATPETANAVDRRNAKAFMCLWREITKQNLPNRCHLNRRTRWPIDCRVHFPPRPAHSIRPLPPHRPHFDQRQTAVSKVCDRFDGNCQQSTLATAPACTLARERDSVGMKIKITEISALTTASDYLATANKCQA